MSPSRVGHSHTRITPVASSHVGLGLADGEPLVIHDMVVDLVVTVSEFEIVAVEISNDIGYPVMIKATAGGGGRGQPCRSAA